jgi:predicted alpha/beta superfamily hydrolase
MNFKLVVSFALIGLVSGCQNESKYLGKCFLVSTPNYLDGSFFWKIIESSKTCTVVFTQDTNMAIGRIANKGDAKILEKSCSKAASDGFYAGWKLKLTECP